MASSANRLPPDRALEATFDGLVCGVDEAGRGPLAGDVVAAAVILPVSFDVLHVDDSKRLTTEQRDVVAEQLHAHALVGIGSASVAEIDALNILQATLLAMHRAVLALPVTPVHALIDGNRAPDGLPCAATSVVHGDSKHSCIAAASIIAKTHRDAKMQTLHQLYPQYGFDRHKGYGTLAHRQALHEYGACEMHRQTFRPVREAVERHAGVLVMPEAVAI